MVRNVTKQYHLRTFQVFIYLRNLLVLYINKDLGPEAGLGPFYN